MWNCIKSDFADLWKVVKLWAGFAMLIGSAYFVSRFIDWMLPYVGWPVLIVAFTVLWIYAYRELSLWAAVIWGGLWIIAAGGTWLLIHVVWPIASPLVLPIILNLADKFLHD